MTWLLRRGTITPCPFWTARVCGLCTWICGSVELHAGNLLLRDRDMICVRYRSLCQLRHQPVSNHFVGAGFARAGSHDGNVTGRLDYTNWGFGERGHQPATTWVRKGLHELLPVRSKACSTRLMCLNAGTRPAKPRPRSYGPVHVHTFVGNGLPVRPRCSTQGVRGPVRQRMALHGFQLRRPRPRSQAASRACWWILQVGIKRPGTMPWMVAIWASSEMEADMDVLVPGTGACAGWCLRLWWPLGPNTTWDFRTGAHVPWRL
mmetsp:Transcript_62532/g.146651  ORF Transcript_62532/g.146651 Transcript_62532/m.146651 type:complete len:262 (+) Transcript_62532:1754-2539(+)